MNRGCLEFLVCPVCQTSKFDVEPYLLNEGEIIEGRLVCPVCKTWFRIESGIVDLLPLNLRNSERYRAFASKHGIPAETGLESASVYGKSTQADFFHENAEHYERDVVSSNYYRALDQVAFINWMKKNLKAGQMVVDLGCGTGRQDIPLAQHGVKAIGIDISEDMLNLAKRKIDAAGLHAFVDLVAGDAEVPPVRDNCFDACIFYGTLHHFPDKKTAIVNASKKIVDNGLFYSLDPHHSPVRFIFDFLMRIWKLYDEEASENPLLSEQQFKEWFHEAELVGSTKLITYLPPHIFQMISLNSGVRLLKFSDALFSHTPVLRKMAGVIVAEGVKKTGSPE